MWPPGAGFKAAGGLGTVKGGFQWYRATLQQCLTRLTNRVCQLLIPRLTGSVYAGSYPSQAACTLCCFSFGRKAGCWGFSERKELQDMADVVQSPLECFQLKKKEKMKKRQNAVAS